MSTPLGKFHTTLVRPERGTLGGAAPRKSSSQNTKNSSGELTQREVMKTCQVIAFSRPIKEMAEIADVVPRAIENVRKGESAFSLLSLAKISRVDPRARALAMRLLGCEDETDPDWVQGISLLRNFMARSPAADASTDEGNHSSADLFGGTLQ